MFILCENIPIVFYARAISINMRFIARFGAIGVYHDLLQVLCASMYAKV